MPEPEGALRHIDDIDATNIFVIGAATKGLQVPGMRIGWAIAAKEHIEIFRNYSSFGMGGVSRASQIYVTQLLERKRVAQSRDAISNFYTEQRNRYEKGLRNLGFELFTGNGGFYHWGRLPQGMTGNEFNERLFKHEAGILPGHLCDMGRTDADGSTLDNFAMVYFYVLRETSAAFVALMNYLIPVWAALLGALVMGEVLPATAWPALILVLSGIAIAQARSNAATVKLVAEARQTGQ